jgi:predicted aldo/keto reductase-like oxidoreductase
MQYTHLGRTGLSVSRLCLGTMNFGPQTSEADSFAIMDKALELGINFAGWQIAQANCIAANRHFTRHLSPFVA